MLTIRSALYDVFQVFDFADPSVLNGHRDQTTVAPQALFMLNSKLVADAARRLAGQLLAEEEMDDGGRIEKLYRVAYSRTPIDSERAAALQYLHLRQTERRGTGWKRRESGKASAERSWRPMNSFI